MKMELKKMLNGGYTQCTIALHLCHLEYHLKMLSHCLDCLIKQEILLNATVDTKKRDSLYTRHV